MNPADKNKFSLLLRHLFLLIFLFLAMASFSIFLKKSAQAQVVITAVVGTSTPAACNDGIDNDSDGKIDYPADPGCASINDNDETDIILPFCGDGSCSGSETCSSCSTDCGICPSGGGGGGGGYAPPPAITTQVIFTGRAYPKSSVTLLKDAQVIAATIASSDANFQITLTGPSTGNYIFSVYSEDREGRRSSLLTFPVSVTAGTITQVSGIFIAPSIAVDKSEVKRGEDIAIFGQSAPSAEILITVSSEEDFFVKTPTDKDGIYLHHFDTSVLDYGFHSVKSKASLDSQSVSSYSYLVSFKVGTKTMLVPAGEEFLKGDLNKDGRVNLIDFSIAAYWYKRVLSESFKLIERDFLNNDGKIDLVDFSIMAYYWTG